MRLGNLVPPDQKGRAKASGIGQCWVRIVRWQVDNFFESCDRNDTGRRNADCYNVVIVHIELTSTLTQEDENRLAAVVLKALSGMLDMLPISYLVRVETTDQSVIEHVSPGLSGWDSMTALAAETSQPIAES